MCTRRICDVIAAEVWAMLLLESFSFSPSSGQPEIPHEDARAPFRFCVFVLFCAFCGQCNTVTDIQRI
jgi:hypothetical protein